ncbi:hypothetical protein KU6B_10730 [Mameliella alba]|nr:hypothetical protein KU6B_10730 [Mameliella alba]
MQVGAHQRGEFAFIRVRIGGGDLIVPGRAIGAAGLFHHDKTILACQGWEGGQGHPEAGDQKKYERSHVAPIDAGLTDNLI